MQFHQGVAALCSGSKPTRLAFAAFSIFVLCLSVAPARAQEPTSGGESAQAQNAAAQQPGNEEPQDVSRFFTPDTKFKERLGETIPEGIMMTDENGNQVDVKSLLNIPAVIVPVYFTCPSACNVLQSSMAAVVPQVNLTPGKDFRVITVSFDETDTPEMARQKQHNFLAATDFKFPAEDWTYLVGDKETIKKFMDSLGFEYIRKGPGDFSHPVGVVVTAPGGKIVRYLYGQGFLPFDLTMAFTEAAEGKTGLSVRRVLAYCFAYDPESRGYVFSFMRVVGAVLIFGLAVLLFVLLRGNKKQKKA